MQFLIVRQSMYNFRAILGIVILGMIAMAEGASADCKVTEQGLECVDDAVKAAKDLGSYVHETRIRRATYITDASRAKLDALNERIRDLSKDAADKGFWAQERALAKKERALAKLETEKAGLFVELEEAKRAVPVLEEKIRQDLALYRKGELTARSMRARLGYHEENKAKARTNLQNLEAKFAELRDKTIPPLAKEVREDRVRIAKLKDEIRSFGMAGLDKAAMPSDPAMRKLHRGVDLLKRQKVVLVGALAALGIGGTAQAMPGMGEDPVLIEGLDLPAKPSPSGSDAAVVGTQGYGSGR